MKRLNISFEYKITLGYLAFGILWILFSDKFVNIMTPDPDVRASLQLIKGWFYVLLTAVFFFFFIKRHLKKLRESEASLSSRNRELKAFQQQLETKNTELIAAKKKAEESNKLKTAFLNNISHEIRTPMNSILGFSGMLTRSDITDKQRSDYAAYIDISTHQLLDMVTDVIELSQIQLGEVQGLEKPCNIVDLLKNIEKTAIKKTAGKDVSFKVNKDLEIETILIDDYKLSRMLRHLVDNAIKFTNEGDVILDVNLSRGRLNIELTDTGIGIPDEIKDSIFEAFRQEELGLTREYGGSGLGLTLVKAFTDLMGGSLNIESTRDVGTHVTLSLPFRLPEVVAASKITAVKKNLSDKTILIADDEVFNYYYLKEVLDQFNMKSLYAANGKDALELFFKTGKIDLILMDIKMPVMDGFEATRRIREHDRTVPVIAQSAYVLEKDDLTKNFTDILPKPILREDLKKIIDKYID